MQFPQSALYGVDCSRYRLRPVDGARVFTVQWSISALWWARTGSSDGGVEVGIEAILLEWVAVQDKVHAVYRVNLYVLLAHASRALYVAVVEYDDIARF